MSVVVLLGWELETRLGVCGMGSGLGGTLLKLLLKLFLLLLLELFEESDVDLLGCSPAPLAEELDEPLALTLSCVMTMGMVLLMAA